MGKLLGVSGKKGSGKDTLCDNVSAILEAAGGTTVKLPVATPLKERAAAIFAAYDDGELDAAFEKDELFVALPQFRAEAKSRLVDIFAYEDAPVNAFGHAHPGVRSFLQWFGSEVGRTYSETYWSSQSSAKIREVLPHVDLVTVPDARFASEIEALQEFEGAVVRLDISAELQRERILARDGYLPSDEAFQHASETSLDSFPFEYRFDASRPEQEIAREVLALL